MTYHLVEMHKKFSLDKQQPSVAFLQSSSKEQQVSSILPDYD